MQKRLVTRYKMPSAATADENHHAGRREGGVDQQTAELVGPYTTTID